MNNSTTSNSTFPSMPYSVEIIRLICIAVWANIILVGLFGNILTVIILAGPKLNGLSTTFYLTVLAIVDLLYLIFSLGGQMFDFALLFPNTMRQSNELACKLLNIIRYSLAYISVWLLVAVSIDRMIWVLLPFKAKLICTRKIAKITVLIFCTFFIGIDIHFIWTVKFIKHKSVNFCEVIDNILFRYIFPYVDLTLIMILPFIIMLISNILIVLKMQKVSVMRQTLHRSSAIPEQNQFENLKSKKNSISPPVNFQHERSQSEISNRTRSESQIKFFKRRQSKLSTKDKQTSSLTRMLLSVNLFFMVSTTPLLVYDVVYYLIDFNELINKNGNYLGGVIFGVERLVYTLWYLNFSIHFLLYCLSGPKFREEAKLFISQYIFKGGFFKNSSVELSKTSQNLKCSQHTTNIKPIPVSNKVRETSIPQYRSVYSCIRETRI